MPCSTAKAALTIQRKLHRIRDSRPALPLAQSGGGQRGAAKHTTSGHKENTHKEQ
tara:strand:- start:368 stop:532 length:165 start_codon:yes stop_codon:yes gene_type:complete